MTEQNICIITKLHCVKIFIQTEWNITAQPARVNPFIKAQRVSNINAWRTVLSCALIYKHVFIRDHTTGIRKSICRTDRLQLFKRRILIKKENMKNLFLIQFSPISVGKVADGYSIIIEFRSCNNIWDEKRKGKN